MAKVLIFKNVDFSSVAIDNTPIGPKHYTIPLLNNSAEKDNLLSITKETATYNDAAVFMNVPSGINYVLPSDDVIKAVAFDFYIDSSFSPSYSRFLINLGNYTGQQVIGKINGLYMFIEKNSLDGKASFAMSIYGNTTIDDSPSITTLTYNVWHRLCYTKKNENILIYIDGQKINANYKAVLDDRMVGQMVLGNGWRFRENNGDRTLGGKMKKVIVWTEDIDENDMVEYSTLEQ